MSKNATIAFFLIAIVLVAVVVTKSAIPALKGLEMVVEGLKGIGL